jgi:hypothetical protein
MSEISNTKNVKRLSTPINYMFGSEDDVLDIDTTGGIANIYLPNIIQSGALLVRKRIYINDVGNNASVNNINIITLGGDKVNGLSSLALADNGISTEIVITNRTEYIANLSTDNGGGGGTVTGADNGLNLLGSVVKLGGSLLVPTTIDALGSNTFSITDQGGLFMQTRDALGNFFFNNIGGTGTLIGSSQYIFSYLGDGGNVFEDSLIVINFGGANNIKGSTDFWNFGDYQISDSSSSIFNFGRFNEYYNCVSLFVNGFNNIFNSFGTANIFGSYNTISNGGDLTVIGAYNSLIGESSKIIIGNNNQNLVVDGTNGYVGINTLTPLGMLHIKPYGSGTAGLIIETVSTQDAKMLFSTNNSATQRGKIWVSDATQTFNFYTVNNDTVFYNGNGLAQVKTLTLFTDTTAKFESNIGIGATPVTNSRVQINNASFGNSSINLGGADYFGIASNTTGLSLLLGVNTGNNKQLWLADQDKLVSNSTNPVLQFGLFGTSPSAINAISTNGTLLNLVLQANGGNLGVGTGSTAPSEKLEVTGNIKLTTKGSIYKIGAYDALSITQNVGGSNIIIGHGNTMNDASNGGGIVIGTFATSSSDGIAIGLSSVINVGTEDGIAIGRATVIAGGVIRGLAIGREATCTADNAWAIGNYVVASNPDTVIFGTNTLGNKQKVGIGTNNPTATTHLRGDANAGTYAFKVDNLAGNPLFYVRNDAFVSINQNTIGVARLEITGGAGAVQGIYTQTIASISINGNDTTGIGVKGQATTGVGLQGNIGGATGSALKLDDNVNGILLMKVGSNGTKSIINAVNLPTSNAGLSSGDMYVDTAINILANGDKVVGWKV